MHIDDSGRSGNYTWLEANNEPWCNFSNGIYIIENLTIDASKSATGSGIIIGNSSVDFIIRNCSINNAHYEIPDAGIKLNNTDNGTIINNNFYNNEKRAILLENSSDNTISGNHVNKSIWAGIHLKESLNNTISGNIIENVVEIAVKIGNSHNNTLTGNIINNASAIGLELSSDSYNNLIYKNAFIGNGLHAIDDNPLSGNFWNNSQIGNYWDNYTDLAIGGIDGDNDGIGDVFYPVWGSAKAIDSLPMFETPLGGDNITIDDDGPGGRTWAWMEFFKFYCTGSGTQSDPYIISDITIDGGKKSSCIIIQDSNVHFRIEGCTLINASEGGGAEYGGLYMRNVSNGTIINNNFSLNGDGGIIVFNGNNMTITGNFIADNQNYGLYGEPFHNSKLTNNIIDNDGIQLRKSENNTISGNIVKNGLEGINVIQNSLNNTISGNVFDNNEVGIYVLDSNDTVILNNEIINSRDVGIQLIESSKTFISYNNISYGQQSTYVLRILPEGDNIPNLKAGGVSLFNCTNNTIMANYINDNAGHGVTLYSSNDTHVIGNIFNFNKLNITYENNSIKNRIEWNLWNKTSVPLIIDESGGGNFTWFQAAYYLLWVSGNGTQSDPYLIKDIIINGTGTTDCLKIWDTHKHFRIENCTFYNSGPGAGTYAGIHIFMSSNGTLIDNNCSANQGSGILISGNTKMNVLNNEIHNNDAYGIYAEGATNYTISGNNIDLNPIILRVNSNYNNISGNTLTNTYIELEGRNNNVTSNYIYDCSATAIKVQYGNNNNISGNTINNLNCDGIYLENCSDTYVMGNNITECYRGIMVRESNNTLITENEIDDGNYGIHISLQCININITGNTISDGTINGIYLFNTTKINITRNLIINQDQDGIYINESTDILVGANIINLNDKYGVYLESTNDTDVEGNIFNYNQFGAFDNDSYCFNNEFDWNVINRVLDPIIIDNAGKGNATWAELAYYTAYCLGKGTKSDPYVLSDLIINAEMKGSGIIINNSKDYFIIKNCDISNSSGGIPWFVDVESGIHLINTVNGMIINNTCSNNNGSGIALDTCVNCTVSNNTINNNGMGIELSHKCYNNTISNNTISNNYYAGIIISDSIKTYLENNTMTNCGMMLGYSKENTHFISTSNTVNGKPLYYYANKTRLGKADFINAGQVLLANCDDSVISNLIIMDTSVGIQLYDCYNNTVFNNTIDSTLNFESYGIVLDIAENNTIYNNTVKNLVVGIILEVNTNNNTVKNNTINNCEWGIALFMDCNNNTIFKNKVNNSAEYGIYLEGCSSNKILNNTANYCEYGIYLNNSHSNFISGNTAEFNNIGIWTNHSIWNILSGNTANHNVGGIFSQSCGNMIISGNNAFYNSFSGIIYFGTNSTISDNILKYNPNGLILGGISRNNTISRNEITYNINRTWDMPPMYHDMNAGGIVLGNCENNTIRANIINFNEGSAIVFYNSNDTVVFGNIFNFNKNGTFSNDTNSFNNVFMWNMVNYTLEPFYIDGDGGEGDFTWHEVANLTAWCTGSGTELDPYVLRDMIIDGGNKSSCIKIDDSNPNVYFTIDNCKLYNCAKGTGGNGGIYITDAYNGLIINNNCSYNNDIGIYARSSRNINMSDNIAHFNRVAGLILYYCNDSVMIGNIANNNGWLGIVSLYGINCRIIGNTANNTEGPGIQVSTPDIIVEGNTVANNQWGIHIQTANDSIISGNILNNNDNGLIIIESTNVTVFENEINFNKNITVVMAQLGQTFNGSGILLVNCTDCTIRTNYINNNAGYALSFYSSNGTEVYGNIMNYNKNGTAYINNSVFKLIRWNAVNNKTDPIHIDDNGKGDFTWNEADELLLWIVGSGTAVDPYIIKDFTIDGKDIDTCLSISNSTIYIVVENCTLINSGTGSTKSGLLLEDVYNAEVLNNMFYRNYYHIYIEDCQDLHIEGNTLNTSSWEAFHLMNSNTTIISNNIIKNGTRSGIILYWSNYLTITHNHIFENDRNGIIGDGYNLNFSHNFVYNNTQKGFDISGTSHSTFYNNSLYYNGGDGMEIQDFNNCTFSFNTIYRNGGCGFDLWYGGGSPSSDNRILNNTILFNNLTGIRIYSYVVLTIISGNNVSFNGQYSPVSNDLYISGISSYEDCANLTITKNYIYNNTAYGIYIYDNTNNNNITDNTVIKNGKSGIYLWQSHNNTITNNTVNNNVDNGILLWKSHNNTIANNTNSFNFNGKNGIFLNESHFNNITFNVATGNPVGIRLEGSDYNRIIGNDLRSNPLGIYERPDCVGNIFQDNILDLGGGVDVVGGDDDDGDGAGPAKAAFDFFIIIIIIIIGAVAAVVVIAVKKSSKKKVPAESKEKIDKVPMLKAVKKEAPPLMPKKAKMAKMAKKAKKAGVIAAADTAAISEAEKKELAKVESEVDVHREKFICIVHKGPITGDVYICSKCNSFYCVRCAKALKEKGDACWACGAEIKVLETRKDAFEKIKQLEKRLESLKGTIKNLDESFFSGAISQKEYTTMKDPIAHKITKILAELEKLRE